MWTNCDYRWAGQTGPLATNAGLCLVGCLPTATKWSAKGGHCLTLLAPWLVHLRPAAHAVGSRGGPAADSNGRGSASASALGAAVAPRPAGAAHCFGGGHAVCGGTAGSAAAGAVNCLRLCSLQWYAKPQGGPLHMGPQTATGHSCLNVHAASEQAHLLLHHMSASMARHSVNKSHGSEQVPAKQLIGLP